MEALLRKDDAHWVLHPQFLANIDGVKQYTPTLVDEVTHFAGWLPYRNKRWPLASNKLAFKKFVQDAGLRTPEYARDNDAELDSVIVKRAASSFGNKILGPFRSSREHPLDTQQEEYYERFIQGQLLKIWFWNAQPVCAELDDMPSIEGDGASSIKDLMARRARAGQRRTESQITRMLQLREPIFNYYGVNQDTVLPRKVSQIIEFRYGSALMQMHERTVIDMSAGNLPFWTADLAEIGRIIHAGIPEALRDNTVFTLDAILDEEQGIWLLEINSNPAIQPLLYPAMIKNLIPAARPTPAVLPASDVSSLQSRVIQ
ncbi:hypothetical protein RB25_11540 [Herbaspirillum rubrisubalbicans]|nr:hypothetical protein RB25_11540 [Herbaspirillum rubrisubalbicans]